jgi:hypothetical protein
VYVGIDQDIFCNAAVEAMMRQGPKAVPEFDCTACYNLVKVRHLQLCQQYVVRHRCIAMTNERKVIFV